MLYVCLYKSFMVFWKIKWNGIEALELDLALDYSLQGLK